MKSFCVIMITQKEKCKEIMDEINQLRKKAGVMLINSGTLMRICKRQVFREKKFAITPEQFEVLAILAEEDGLYQRQIAAIMLKDRPNITRIINILESGGYVNRVEDTNRRKVFKVFLTEKGHAIYKQIQPAIYEMRNEINVGIEKEDIEICLEVLGKFQANLEKKVNMQI